MYDPARPFGVRLRSLLAGSVCGFGTATSDRAGLDRSPHRSHRVHGGGRAGCQAQHRHPDLRRLTGPSLSLRAGAAALWLRVAQRQSRSDEAKSLGPRERTFTFGAAAASQNSSRCCSATIYATTRRLRQSTPRRSSGWLIFSMLIALPTRRGREPSCGASSMTQASGLNVSAGDRAEATPDRASCGRWAWLHDANVQGWSCFHQSVIRWRPSACA